MPPARHMPDRDLGEPASRGPGGRKGWLLLLAALGVGAAVLVPGRLLDRPAPVAVSGQPNFVIIDIDTLSMGHVGSTRNGVPVTPNLDALAARGVAFTSMVSQAGWTLPALTSLLTGRAPIPSKVGGRGAIAWKEAQSHDIPEILGLYGYRSAAAWGATIAGPTRARKAQAFDESIGGQELPDPAVEQWLSAPPQEPFLLFLHEIDLHHPQSFDSFDALRGVPTPTYEVQYGSLVDERGPEAARDEILARYDAELTRYDARVGDILGALDRGGLSERTVVIVTSNHGEDLFSHTIADHGLLYDTVLRVPLIIADPASPRTGEVEDAVVQTVDLAPTVLARAGAAADAGMDGQSMLSLLGLGGEPHVERAVYSMTDGCTVSLRQDGFKLIITSRPPSPWLLEQRGPAAEATVRLADLTAEPWMEGVSAPACRSKKHRRRPLDRGTPEEPPGTSLLVELYDLGADPGEQHNLAAGRSRELVSMLPALMRWRDERVRAAAGAPREAMTPQQEQALREQGYWKHVDRDGTTE